MSAHILLNLLNSLRKGDKIIGKPRILPIFTPKKRKRKGKEVKCEACRAFYHFFATS